MRISSPSRHSRSQRAPAGAISPRKRPQQERSQATVDAILQAAAQVLVRDGYDRATTGLIAAAAGVSIGTVYQYFPNKDSIFSELLKRQLDQVFEESASAVAAAAPDLESQCRAAIRGILGAKAKNPKLHHALKTQLGRLDGARLVRSLKARSLEMAQAMLRTHAPALAVADIDRAAFLIVHAIDGVIDAILADSPATLGDARIADEMADMVLRFLRG